MKSFLRRLEILNYLLGKKTSHSHAVGTDAIVDHLRDAGYLDRSSDLRRSQFRLVQRDMQFLLGEEFEGQFENDFGLTVERGDGKSLLWSLDPYQHLSYDFERMPAYMALAMQVSQKHLSQVLPSQTRQELADLFARAANKLQQADSKLSSKHYRRLTRAVEFYQRGQSLQAPDYSPDTLDLIYQAILQGKRIDIRYLSGSGIREYCLHPYGVAIMLPKLYLIAKKDEDMTPENEAHAREFRSFLVHKIESISLSRLGNRVPDDFELTDYLQQGRMDVLVNNRDDTRYALQIELCISETGGLLSDLKDSPLSADQVLAEVGDGVWHLSATVRRTVQLRNWLLSLGSQATVLSPPIIRDDLVAHLRAISNNYTD